MVLNEITSLSLYVVFSNKFDFSSYPSLESGNIRLQVLGWCFGFVRALFENVELHPAGTKRRSQVTGHRVQVTGHRSQGTGHRSQGTGYRAQGTGHRS